jgi:hypothetical protein
MLSDRQHMIHSIPVRSDQELLGLGIHSIMLKIGSKRSKEMLFEPSLAAALIPIVHCQRRENADDNDQEL